MAEQINFQIKAIETLELSINQFDGEIPEEMQVGYNYELQHNINVEHQVTAVVCTLKISDQKSKKTFGRLKVACIYHIVDIEKYLSEDKKTVLFPEGFNITLNSITLSTVRGIAYARFQGTYLQNAILPIIDPKSFVLGDPQ
ncbi:hypothetical protein [Jiulongibacter sediminis]|uniref:Preprotein translocase subunit SecB n=1 Tax=Jiulongibacter sediminis TaxID=1605367 RepID=A0A0P7BYE7_9BACT|nr:hypothetical protein [Jiulongibacter sediminis]KPM46585.1 hypothetical protein AFM12_19200 [Jiulongibacter sediminis]TBX21158.1 hypothetical protein TK44_19205 [Jiulongibacter sediminis]